MIDLFFFACSTAAAILSFSLVANLPAQEPMETASPLGSSALATTVTGTENTATPEPAADSNLHSTVDLRNEVSADPRRFHYGLDITFRGVYDDNINISQTDRVSDFYFTIEPTLTLGFGDIIGREENFLRLDYAPSLF